MARTVNHISGGRLILGLGAGFREKEYLEYGYEFPTPGGRVDALREALERVTARLPKLNPLPGRVPILVAGGGDRVLRLVAEYADIWNTFAGSDELAAKIGRLERYCGQAGRDIGSIECEVMVKGDPEECAAPFRALGVNRFVVMTHGPDWNLDDLRTWLTWRDRQPS